MYKKYLRKLLYGKRLHCFTDSHGEVLEFIQKNKLIKSKINVCKVVGATASGLKNPNSQTKAHPVFKSYFKQYVVKKDPLLFMLGEVDCGFSIWVSAEKKNLAPEELMFQSLQSYEQFVKGFQQKNQGKIYLISAILPTIKDGSFEGEVANLRSTISADQQSRTELTLKFNEGLEACCVKNNWGFIDLDKYLLNPQNRTVREGYLNEDKTNHHLSNKALSKVLVNELEKIGF